MTKNSNIFLEPTSKLSGKEKKNSRVKNIDENFN